MKLTEEAQRKGMKLLVGCDANSHHVAWGSTNTNRRGQALIDFLNTKDLITLNVGNKATFVNRIREEVLDITFCSEDLINEIQDWRVSDEHSFSDHRYIRFKILRPPPKPIKFRNRSKTDWVRFGTGLRNRLGLGTSQCRNKEDIDAKVETLTNALVESFEESCPLRERRSPQEKPWVTGEIRDLGRNLRKLFNRAKRKKTAVYWDEYHSRLKEYRKITRKAKRDSWKLFCEQVDSVNDVSRIKKFLSKTHLQPGSMVDETGRRLEDIEEIMELLMDSHFPPTVTGVTEEPLWERGDQNGGMVITTEMIKKAIRSFAPYKAAGLDGIFPALLQREVDLVSTHLSGIFTACLKFAYTPVRWQVARVVFIPKPGKPTYATPKAYRPISLTSFLLKTMERIVDAMIKSGIQDSDLKYKQHAYVKGRSVETALNEVVHYIRKSFDDKLYTLAVCIDIEGAFNNVLTDTLIRSLDQFLVDRALSDWITHMLRNRWISCEMYGVTTRRRVLRGTPQGGILSPLLWVTTINSLLRTLTEAGFQPVCYADDVVILLRGRDPNYLCRRAETALNTAFNWARPRGLNVNPEKTEICLFTGRTKIPAYEEPRFSGRTIAVTDRVKYLGVTLDRKLKWKHHIEDRTNRASRCWALCRRTIGPKWGLRPNMIHWLYKSVIRPILTYASVIWWTSLDKGCNIRPLQGVQRTCCLGISGAMCTTSTRALETLLDIPPIETQVRYEAALAAERLLSLGELYIGDFRAGHQCILGTLPGYTHSSDIPDRIPETETVGNCGIMIPERGEWSGGTLVQMPVGICCYTDGSKLRNRTGIGVFVENPETEIFYRLPDHNTSFQAEVRAITECVEWIGSNMGRVDANIFTDSQRAIRAISASRVKSKTLLDCRRAITEFSYGGRIHIIWVPGHSGIAGNERANTLAIRGRELEAVNLANAKPFEATKAELKAWARETHTACWNNGTVARTTRILWGNPDKRRTKGLLNGSKSEVSMMVRILTGHAGLRAQLYRIGRADSDECRACGEESETLEHFLCHCQAFAELRSRHLGSDILSDLESLRNVNWRTLRSYVRETRFLNTGH